MTGINFLKLKYERLVSVNKVAALIIVNCYLTL